MVNLYISNSNMKKILLSILTFGILFFIIDWGIARFFQYGVDKYFGLNQKADILLIGHSQMLRGCSNTLMEKELQCKVSKYCREGVTIRNRAAMIEHFYSIEGNEHVPFVLFGVDFNLFNETDLSINSHKIFYPFMDIPTMDKMIREFDSPYDYWLHKCVRTARYNDFIIYRSIRGWLNNWDVIDRKVISQERWATRPGWQIYRPAHAVKQFTDTVDFILSRGSCLVLVHPAAAESWRKYDPQAYEEMVNFYKSIADNHPKIEYLDYNPQLSDKREYFSDPIHLNAQGQIEMTKLLIEDMKKIMAKHKKP